MSYVSNTNFKFPIEKLNPLSIDYRIYWQEERRRCIEGFWSGGKYMPGSVYQYVNHWKIELNKGKNSKNKVIDNPFLRDLEWEKGYLFMEARGFSGFEYEKYYTSDRKLKDELMFYDEFENKRIIATEQDIELINLNSKRYTPVHYVEAREYLRWTHKEDLGRPLMQNDSKNVVDIEARGGGKSFFAANLIAWNFLHDGVFWYEELKNKSKSETLVGAIDTKFSSGLLKKVKLGLESLSGGVEIGDIYYPPPFTKKYSGSWESGKTIVAEYDQKVGNNWVKKGSKSMIHHRSFADNPMAANGTRPSLACLEEVGFMDNLLLSLGQLKECTMNSAEKFGTIWMFGTGGDMAGGSTEAVKEVFYNPNGYDCLVFDDEFENKGKIGYFVPAWKALNQFKDEIEGVTDIVAAKGYLEKERLKLSNGRSKQPLYDELQNRPLLPSEAFLVQQGNIFPTAELKEHLSNLESSQRLKELAATGWMQRDPEGKAYFKVDHDMIACDYPTKYSKDIRGAIEIWEQPIDKPQYGTYIAGIDPYDQDQADSSPSLGSIIVYKRFVNSDQTYHLPVAEYSGRPEFANDFYEQCRRLLEYYNAKALYENEKTGLKSYFETKNCLHLLSRQPSIIKSISPNSKVDRIFGTHMTQQIKDGIEIMTRDWLKTELEPGILQLTKIKSVPLLKELIGYNKDGNFDRVIAFMLVVMQDLDMHAIQVEEAEKEVEVDNFFTRQLFVNRQTKFVNY